MATRANHSFGFTGIYVRSMAGAEHQERHEDYAYF
jgi:hypothetical protein